MEKEQLTWIHNKDIECYNSACDGFEYIIQPNYWNMRPIHKLYIVIDGKQNHITGNKSSVKLKKLAEADLVRRQN